MSDECTISTHPEYGGRCCCNCKWHAEDHSHPNTDGLSMSAKRGYVCLAPEFIEGRVIPLLPETITVRIVFSGFPAHGMCEMHDFWVAK